MNTWDAVRGILWPRSAPVPDRRLKVQRTNGAALKGGWVMPDPWAGYWGAGIALTEGRSATYAQLYERQPWVYAVCNKLIKGIGRLPLKAYGTGENGDRFRLRNAPLATLLNAPYERGSPTSLKQRIIGDLAVYGNALLVIGRDRATAPASYLQPVHPQGWRFDDEGNYRRYRPGTAEEEVVPPWRMVHFKFYRPGDDLGWGLSPMEPLRQTLLVEDAAQRLASSFFEQGAMPGLSIEAAPGTPMLSPEQIALIRAQVDMLHGGPSNAGKALILGGLKANPLNVDFGAAAVVDHRKLTREEVCAAYEISPVLVGILERATNNNIEDIHIGLYVDAFGPWLTLIEETLQAQLLAGVQAYAGNFVEFDLNEVLKGNIQARYDAINKAVGGPWMKVEEARRLENLPSSGQPEADLIHFPLNMSSNPATAQDQAPPTKGYSANGHAHGHAADEPLVIAGGD